MNKRKDSLNSCHVITQDHFFMRRENHSNNNIKTAKQESNSLNGWVKFTSPSRSFQAIEFKLQFKIHQKF